MGLAEVFMVLFAILLALIAVGTIFLGGMAAGVNYLQHKQAKQRELRRRYRTDTGRAEQTR